MERSAMPQIEVKLTQEASNALGATWAVLDLPVDFSFRLSKDAVALSDINQFQLDGVLPFSVPYSTVNDLALLPFTNVAILDNNVEGIECRAQSGSYQLPFDQVYFKSKNDNSRTWELELRFSAMHWATLASRKTLCSVSLGSATIEEFIFQTWVEPAFILDDAVAGQIVRWPVVDYGGWIDLDEAGQFSEPPVKQVWMEDLRPWFSVPELLRLGMCEIGWKLDGLILETEWMRRKWAYLLSQEYYTQTRGGDAKMTGIRATLTDQNIVSGGFLLLDSMDYDPGGNAEHWTLSGPGGTSYAAGYLNPLPFKTTFKYCFFGTVVAAATGSPLPIEFSIGVFDTTGFTGEILVANAFTVQLAAGESRYVTFCTEFDLGADQRAFVRVNGGNSGATLGKIRRGFRFSAEPSHKAFTRGDVLDLARCIDCRYTLLDLLKGVAHLANARIDTDWLTQTVTILPYENTLVGGEQVPGFIREGNDIIDIGGITICDSIRVTPLRAQQKKYTQFSFQKSTDAYVESLNLPEPPYSRKIFNGAELPEETLSLSNPFFEPTLEGQPTTLKRWLPLIQLEPEYQASPMLPRLWDNTDGLRSFAIAPRILHMDYTAQVDPANANNCQIYFEGAHISTFLYGSHIPSFELGTPQDPPGELVYGTRQSDLFVTFYLGDSLAKRRGFLVDLLIYMNQAQYGEWDFRTRFLFLQNGLPIIAYGQSIRDFAPSLDIPTPMQLLVSPSRSGCCDLPCSCQFTECEYYQDLGQFLQQETLDDLYISSFVVDDLEQLEAPVDLGIIRLVNMFGIPYVTNLVDALNSIGVPYFSFNYSGRAFATKGDGRYFKIKHPSCQKFTIEISNGDGVVYRYTESIQEQSWFTGTFEDFGYSGETTGVPEFCVTTIEY